MINGYYSNATTALGAFLGMTELYEKGLVTPEHLAEQCIRIAKERREAISGNTVDGQRSDAS